MELYAFKYVGGSQTGDYSIFKVTRAWSEEEADWNNASYGQQWSKEGGDYSSQAVAKVTAWPRSNGKTWMPFDVLDAVQEFVENPEENFGFMIVNTRKTQEVDFYSSEYTNKEQRPKLTITYDYDEETGIVPRAASAAAPKGLTVRAQHRDLHVFGNGISQAVMLTITRPNGKCLLSGRITPGGEKLLTGLNPGVYFITIRGNNRQRSTIVTILP